MVAIALVSLHSDEFLARVCIDKHQGDVSFRCKLLCRANVCIAEELRHGHTVASSVLDAVQGLRRGDAMSYLICQGSYLMVVLTVIK